MHHYFEAITNTAGQSLIGYFARVINPATQAVVTLASDNNGTPISVVSGVANMAKTDDFGNISLYVDPGTYNLEIFGPDATSFLFRVANVAMNSSKGDQGDPGPAGPQGEGLADVMAPTGASKVGYGVRNLQQVLDNLYATPEEYGALGNRTNDDGPALNAALQALAAKGGGRLVLGRNKTYRTTQTIRVPDSCMIEGPVPVQYPFNGALGAAYIEADFPEGSKLRWVVETATTRVSNNAPLAYNEVASGSLDTYNATYNVGFRNFGIRSRTSVIPYGGLRATCTPGLFIDGVGVSGVGTGFLVNFCFDAWVRAHSMGMYVGFATWDDVNASTLKLYAAQDYSGSKSIPSAYRLGFMPAFDNTLVAARGMQTDAHTTRALGLVMGSSTSLCVNCDITFVSERYSDACLLLNVSGIEFTRFYTEGAAGAVDCAIAAWSAGDVSIRKLHAFTSGGVTFDLGAGVNMEVAPGGIINTASYGSGPFIPDGSRLIVRNTTPDAGPLAPATPSRNVMHVDLPGSWRDLPAGNGWANNSTFKPQYRLSKNKLEFRGFATGGVTGDATVWTLPEGYRPSFLQNLTGGFGCLFSVGTDGAMKISSGSVFGLDGVTIPL